MGFIAIYQALLRTHILIYPTFLKKIILKFEFLLKSYFLELSYFDKIEARTNTNYFFRSNMVLINFASSLAWFSRVNCSEFLFKEETPIFPILKFSY